MSRTVKVLLGILTYFPFIATPLQIYLINSFQNAEQGGSRIMELAPFLVVVSVEFIILTGIVIYYVFHVLTRASLDRDKKVIWAVCLVVFNCWATFIYWYLYIWKQPVSSIPELSPHNDRKGDEILFCTSCGSKYLFNTYSCEKCGKPLHVTGGEC